MPRLDTRPKTYGWAIKPRVDNHTTQMISSGLLGVTVCSKENDITPCSMITYLLPFSYGMAHKVLQSETRGGYSQSTRWVAGEIFEIDRSDVRVRGEFRNAAYQIN